MWLGLELAEGGKEEQVISFCDEEPINSTQP